MLDTTSTASSPSERPPPPRRAGGAAGGPRCAPRWSSPTAGWRSLLGLALLAVVISGVVAALRAGDRPRRAPGAAPRDARRRPDDPRRGGRPSSAARRPSFKPADVVDSHGVYLVYGESETHQAYVDPGSGRFLGIDDIGDGVMGFLDNLHLCGLSCKGYAGYLPFLEKPAHILGNEELTVGGLILAVTGVLLLFLAATGLVVWWPGIRRLARGLRVRRRQGIYAFNYDLHNVVGLAAIPFLVMWGFTGAHFELKQFSELWYAVLPGRGGGGARGRVQAAAGQGDDDGPGRGDRPQDGAGRPARVGLGARRRSKKSTYFAYLARGQRPLRPRRLAGQRRRHDRPLQRQGDDHLPVPGRSAAVRPDRRRLVLSAARRRRSSTAGGA